MMLLTSFLCSITLFTVVRGAQDGGEMLNPMAPSLSSPQYGFLDERLTEGPTERVQTINRFLEWRATEINEFDAEIDTEVTKYLRMFKMFQDGRLFQNERTRDFLATHKFIRFPIDHRTGVYELVVEEVRKHVQHMWSDMYSYMGRMLRHPAVFTDSLKEYCMSLSESELQRLFPVDPIHLFLVRGKTGWERIVALCKSVIMSKISNTRNYCEQMCLSHKQEIEALGFCTEAIENTRLTRLVMPERMISFVDQEIKREHDRLARYREDEQAIKDSHSRHDFLTWKIVNPKPTCILVIPEGENDDSDSCAYTPRESISEASDEQPSSDWEEESESADSF